MDDAPASLKSVLGIDIGSVSLYIVQLDAEGRTLQRFNQLHKGNIREAFSEAEKSFDLPGISAVSCTSSSIYLNKKLVRSYNPQVSIMAAARKYCPEALSVLHIGAEKFMLIRLDSRGKYKSASVNSSCAAGTGSFLDQQALRLNLSGIEDLCEKASVNTGEIPAIASRCAVFSRTDIIHAQQRGFSVNSICNSLCKGLAENIFNTVFSRENPAFPVLLTGGVSKNSVVRSYLENQLKTKFLLNTDSAFFGAIGAGLMLLKDNTGIPVNINSFNDILTPSDNEKQFFHEPLSLRLSNYPDFSMHESFIYRSKVAMHPADVEVDIYSEFLKHSEISVYTGIDIGSTSTKAMMIDENKKPIAGFYTYTAGQPLSAVKSILEAVVSVSQNRKVDFIMKGVGTTGSGRKFIGRIIKADLIIDEISSHARAAFELNPNTDTIIEIGGQDAKFTLLHEGNVIFSQMNTVCAAGTGSFLQEQANKLGCSLSDFSLVENVRAPLASDRCAVFMERDISQLLNNGYSVNEILATALHSVTENYLQKVSTEAAIGNNICFQGATAKNKALIAAFEQRLKKPVYVSEYCHLTGALGTALLLHEEKILKSSFRGIEFYREETLIETETCSMCTNNCCISVAMVAGEKVAFGFMCGRDYDTHRFISSNKTGFDLLKTRKKLFRVVTSASFRHNITIGIPAALHVFDELPLWKRFFDNLSVRTVSSEDYNDPVKAGKCLAGAEFCSPVNSIFGHVVYLSEKADYIFLPVILQKRDNSEDNRGHYCYYTQFSAPLVYTLKINNIHHKCLSPLLSFQKGKFHVAQMLLQCLKPVLKNGISYVTVLNAFNEALDFCSRQNKQLSIAFKKEFHPENEISVVLFGRPYIVLSNTLNKGIPEIFNRQGIKAFYQDMISPDEPEQEDITILLKKVPWYYVSKILEVARVAAETKNLYPVLITAFKCAPDSFIIEYFRKIFNDCRKPYLILQIDEHDSNIGYETRIEAAIRSFRNHAAANEEIPKTNGKNILPQLTKNMAGKTLLLPGWDPIVSPLLASNLKRIGIDARLMKSSELIIRKSMAHNSGQCIPVNIIAQEFIEYITRQKMDPAKTMLWGTESKVSCNLRLYPEHIKTIFEKYGRGFEKAEIYNGLLTHLDISFNACYYAYFAYLLGGLIRMTGHRIRPYEINKGDTDRVLKSAVEILDPAFLGKEPMEKAVSRVISMLDGIPRRDGNKPKVAIFGDFYICDNDLINQDLSHAIEEAGGEVITTPYTDVVKMTLGNVVRRAVYRGEYFNAAQLRVLGSCLSLLEDKYYRYFERFLGKKKIIKPKKLEKYLGNFNIKPYHSGESYENILKIFYFMENYPGISLFVQANPAFCCPALVTEAMSGEITRITGVPVVTITYDGTNDYKNDVIVPYLQ